VAAGLTTWWSSRPGRSPAIAMACVVVIASILGTLTWRQSGDYVDDATLFRRTLERNPSCWLAHNNIGAILCDVLHEYDEAAACFRKAIDIARQQRAKSLELRAVMSLVRLRQHQAQYQAPRSTSHDLRTSLDESLTMLSDIYQWFTEGFDTRDLQEAKVLLDTLSD